MQIVLDLNLARHFQSNEVKIWLGNSKVLTISLSNDDEATALSVSYGAVALLDKMHPSDELVPAIVRTAFPTDSAVAI